jgi:hypothetical protein
MLGVGVGWSIAAFRSPVAEEAKASEALATRFERLERSIARLEQSLADRPPIVVETGANTVAAFDEARVRRSIEGIVQSELRGAISKSSPRWEGDSPEGEATPAAEREEAYERAHETVLSALARRRWTDEDREGLRDAMSRLTPVQRQEVAGGLVQAINEGHIEIEGPSAF